LPSTNPTHPPPVKVRGPAETVRSWSVGARRSADADGTRLQGVQVAGEIFDDGGRAFRRMEPRTTPRTGLLRAPAPDPARTARNLPLDARAAHTYIWRRTLQETTDGRFAAFRAGARCRPLPLPGVWLG